MLPTLENIYRLLVAKPAEIMDEKRERWPIAVPDPAFTCGCRKGETTPYTEMTVDYQHYDFPRRRSLSWYQMATNDMFIIAADQLRQLKHTIFLLILHEQQKKLVSMSAAEYTFTVLRNWDARVGSSELDLYKTNLLWAESVCTNRSKSKPICYIIK